MAYKYSKQKWNNYDKKKDAIDQPEAVISKAKMEHIELGIQECSRELVTKVQSDFKPDAYFENDDINKEKVLNITFPINDTEPASNETIGGAKAKTRDYEDMEIAIGSDDRFYGGILRSPNGSRFKLVVDDNGNLSTERVI